MSPIVKLLQKYLSVEINNEIVEFEEWSAVSSSQYTRRQLVTTVSIFWGDFKITSHTNHIYVQ